MNNHQLKIKTSKYSLRIENTWFYYELSRESAGLPSRMGFQGEQQPVFEERTPLIHAERNGALLARAYL